MRSTNRMNNNRRYKWIKSGISPEGKTAGVLAREVAQHTNNALRGNKKEFSIGIILESPALMVNSNILFELIKVYIFEESAQHYFPNSVRFSPSRGHVLMNVVESDKDRSRNYFARRAADLASIPLEVVQTATNLSVAYNVGASKNGESWYPPQFVSMNESTLPLIQLLTVIFTNERVFPVWAESSSSDTTSQCLKLLPFNPSEGSQLFARLYEHHLLHGEEQIASPEETLIEASG